MTAVPNDMQWIRTFTHLCLVLLPLTMVSAARTGNEFRMIKELLGRPWPAELVHFEYTFAPGEWREDAAQMVDADGQKTPAQLSVSRRHADGSVAEAQVWFVTSLEPGAIRRFKLVQAMEGSGDLRVKRDGAVLEVSNGLVGGRFHLGDKRFDPPLGADEVPAFLTALQLRGGAWTGRGWFETPKKCRSYKVELIESGPVFAKIAFEYRFDGYRGEGGDIYRGTAQITAGQEIIYLTEEFSLGDPVDLSGAEVCQRGGGSAVGLVEMAAARGGGQFLFQLHARRSVSADPRALHRAQCHHADQGPGLRPGSWGERICRCPSTRTGWNSPSTR